MRRLGSAGSSLDGDDTREIFDGTRRKRVLTGKLAQRWPSLTGAFFPGDLPITTRAIEESRSMAGAGTLRRQGATRISRRRDIRIGPR